MNSGNKVGEAYVEVKAVDHTAPGFAQAKASAEASAKSTSEAYAASAKSMLSDWSGASRKLISTLASMGALVGGTAAAFYALGASIREAFSGSTASLDKMVQGLNALGETQRISALRKALGELANTINGLETIQALSLGVLYGKNIANTKAQMRSLGEELARLEERGRQKAQADISKSMVDERVKAEREVLDERTQLELQYADRIEAIRAKSADGGDLQQAQAREAIRAIEVVREKALADYDAKVIERQTRETDAAMEANQRVLDAQLRAADQATERLSAGLSAIANQQRALTESSLDRVAVAVENLLSVTNAMAKAQPRRLN